MTSDRAALFVRLSAPLLSDLEQRIRSDGRTKQAVVEDLLATQLKSAVTSDDEILDLPAAAALLRVAEADVLARITHGDFPARRFGSDWRVSRSALLTWLAGTDSPTDRQTGFSAR